MSACLCMCVCVRKAFAFSKLPNPCVFFYGIPVVFHAELLLHIFVVQGKKDVIELAINFRPSPFMVLTFETLRDQQGLSTQFYLLFYQDIGKKR